MPLGDLHDLGGCRRSSRRARRARRTGSAPASAARTCCSAALSRSTGRSAWYTSVRAYSLLPQLPQRGVRDEDRQLVRVEVARELRLVGEHARPPRTTRRRFAPSRPRAGCCRTAFRATSVPMNATRRRRSTSSSFRNRPAPGVSARMTPYSGATPRTPTVVWRFAVGHGKLLEDLGADVLDEAELGDERRVVLLEADAAPGPLAAGLHAGLPAAHDADAVGERVAEADDQRAVEAVAVGQQQHHRDDAPRDAEHRQAGAEPVIAARPSPPARGLLQQHWSGCQTATALCLRHPALCISCILHCASCISLHLVPQRFDRRQRSPRGAPGRSRPPRRSSDSASTANVRRLPRHDHPGEPLGHRREVDERAQARGRARTRCAPLSERQQQAPR